MISNELPRVEVLWIDAELDISATAELSDLSPFMEDLPLVQDLGYLVSLDRERLILAVSRSLVANDVRHRNAIPTSLIQELRYLETGKCLTKTQLLAGLRTPRKANSSTATVKKTSRPGSSSGSVSNLPSTTAPSTTPSPVEPSP